MAFKFRYQKVLEIRISEEDEAKKVLASKIADMERIKQQLRKTKHDKVVFEQKILEEMKEGVGAKRIASYNRFKKWYRDEINNFEMMLEGAKHAVKYARSQLMLATQEVKKIEKLKENAYNEYKFNEQKAMNEMIEEAVSFMSSKNM